MVFGSPPTVGYWIGDASDDGYPRAALDALSSYRVAEHGMRKRFREAMDMNDTDLAALGFVVRAKSQGDQVTPTDLMNHLGVTMASITVMIDRLEHSGHLRREMNPFDRRSRIVTSTESADEEMRARLAAMHDRMMGAARDMTREEVDTVVDFLARMERAVDGVLPRQG